MNPIASSLLFLGTGGAAGVPLISCTCPVCLSDDPLNKRLRSSVMIHIGHRKILIDAGPDFRLQALKYSISQLEGVLITHTHFDHIAGLDELRTFYILHRQVVPILLSKTSMEEIKVRFPYLFLEKIKGRSLSAQIDFQILQEERGSIDFEGVKIRYMTYEQGGMKVTGFRFGELAYISDIREYPQTLFKDLDGVKTLIVSALRSAASPVHFSVEEAIQFSREVGAKKTYFTHMSHEIDHQTCQEALPKGFELAHDGLKVEFEHYD